MDGTILHACLMKAINVMCTVTGSHLQGGSGCVLNVLVLVIHAFRLFRSID